MHENPRINIQKRSLKYFKITVRCLMMSSVKATLWLSLFVRECQLLDLWLCPRHQPTLVRWDPDTSLNLALGSCKREKKTKDLSGVTLGTPGCTRAVTCRQQLQRPHQSGLLLLCRSSSFQVGAHTCLGHSSLGSEGCLKVVPPDPARPE